MEARNEQGEEGLIRRFQDGDAEAFEALFKRHTPVLISRIMDRLRAGLSRRFSIEDVLQEARIAAFECRRDFEGDNHGDLRKWLYGIADHKARGAMERHSAARRAAKREVSRDGRLETGQFAGAEPSPSQNAMASETQQLIAEAMGRLSPDHREVLRLVVEERLSLAEAADCMGRSYDAIQKLHGRALYRFSELFERMSENGHE